MTDEKNDKTSETQKDPKGAAKPAAKADLFDAKWLKGKTYRTSEAKKAKGEDGKEHTRYVPVTRPLTQDDLLDWKLIGEQVVMVTKDGRKYRMQK